MTKKKGASVKDPKGVVKQAVEEHLDDTPRTIELSTGVILRYKEGAKVARLLGVVQNLTKPEIPTFTGPDGKQMKNLLSSQYREEVDDAQLAAVFQWLNTCIGHYTEIEKTPRGMPKPKDDSWVEELVIDGFPVMPHNKHWRYLNWVKEVASNDVADLFSIAGMVAPHVGVKESTVQAVMDNFPGSDEG